jgi:hypothetical protein
MAIRLCYSDIRSLAGAEVCECFGQARRLKTTNWDTDLTLGVGGAGRRCRGCSCSSCFSLRYPHSSCSHLPGGHEFLARLPALIWAWIDFGIWIADRSATLARPAIWRMSGRMRLGMRMATARGTVCLVAVGSVGSPSLRARPLLQVRSHLPVESRPLELH